ncbi:MAG TPA: ABC transporter permease [Candidatus Angelobacter sp.]|jgi:predicted permease|nr:ABC transporter permease [Candidatus Angelobacter sp.]
MQGAWLETLLQDVRYGFRMLAKAPGFAAVAILTLALGIGANTAIFSVVNGVILNPVPFHDGDQLVSLFQASRTFSHSSISYPNFVDWRRMNTTFAGMAAYRSDGFTLTGSGDPERLPGEMVSHGFFEILGVSTLIGRTFTEEEDRIGANPTVMITEGLWRRKFGADSKILGRQLILNGHSRTVIGVVPSSFHLRIQNFQRGAPLNEVYLPIGEFNEPRFYSARSSGWGMNGIGRLKPGVTLQQAQADMDNVSRSLAATYPDVDTGLFANVTPLKREMVGGIGPILLLLLAAVVFVLLISCVNVANLLLARSTARQHEFAVRVALGASQGRVLRQLLTESILLAVFGGALGVLMARLGTKAGVALMPGGMPRSEEIGLDLRVLFFAFLISIIAGIVFGLAPAWKTSRANIGSALKEAGRTLAARRSRAQSIFVVGEMAMALVLLVGAGLMIRTLTHLWGQNPGFDSNNVLTFDVSGPAALKKGSADAVRATYRQIRHALESTPGVQSVAISFGSHPMAGDMEETFWFPGRPKPAHMTDLPNAIEFNVEPDYFKVMGIQLKRGRFFSASDTEHTAPVVLIDETLAEKYFHGQNPIGQFIDPNTDDSDPQKLPVEQVIGVVGHVNQWGLDTDSRPGVLQAEVFEPFLQLPDWIVQHFGVDASVYVRTQTKGSPDFDTLRRRILEANHDIVVFAPEDLDHTVAESIASKSFTMTLMGIFAGLALILAAIGIYGVLSYLVGQRTQEIGVRMALGARPVQVLRLILQDGIRLTLRGVLIGALAALILTRWMESVLFGVSPTDPVTFISVAALLSAVALLACYVPARRAMRVNPLEALRHE